MRGFLFMSVVAIAAGAGWHGLAAAGPGTMGVAGGQSYWEGDPGPISDPYWTSGQYKFDPNGYMQRNWWDPEYHPMTVFGDHSGKENCVFRRRVQITSWDFQHPILRICRTPPKD
jgi:hypothetical protein